MTLLNGREYPRYAFSDMISSPTQLISLTMTLVPGDVILYGTSPGAMPMQPGSTVEVIIEGIGKLVNEYRAAD